MRETINFQDKDKVVLTEEHLEPVNDVIKTFRPGALSLSYYDRDTRDEAKEVVREVLDALIPWDEWIFYVKNGVDKHGNVQRHLVIEKEEEQ